MVWSTYDDDQLAMSVAYTTTFPAVSRMLQPISFLLVLSMTDIFSPLQDLNRDADIAEHEAKMTGPPLGLVSKNGTVLRYVDFAPGYECMMHRTQSLDYGIVLEGTITSVLDSGEETVMERGDVMVQRATMHSWRNDSATEWARMIFCLQDIKPLFVGGERLGEDLGRGTEDVPPSGNDG